MVQTTLEAGGDTLMGKDNLGYDLLTIALTMGYIDLATLLVQKGANNLSGKDSRSSNKSIHPAIQQGNAELVRFLLGHGVFVNVISRTDQGLTSLHIAIIRRGWDIARILVKRGAQVDVPITGLGRTSLYLAAATGSVEGVRFLVEIGADPKLKAENGFYALYIAAQEGYIDIV
jgi:serine/threonine-protein phosphatase 6 regulatory ankyrin repeat subunit B